MKSKKVHEVLSSKIPKINEEIRKINHGGCGLFAQKLSRELREKGVRCSVVLVDSNLGYSKSKVRRAMAEVGAKSVSALWKKVGKGEKGDLVNGHLVVRYGKRIYDSTGDVTEKYKVISDPIDDAGLDAGLKNERKWNDTFTYENGNYAGPRISRYCRKVLKNIK